MAKIVLRPVEAIGPEVAATLEAAFRRLQTIVPGCEAQHVGATAIPGALTKGDVDIVVRVSPADFAPAVTALQTEFQVKQGENWSADFASFGDDTGYALPLGVQLVVAGSSADFFLFLRDYFMANPAAVVEYNRLKEAQEAAGEEAYWQAKDAFLSKILAAWPGPVQE